MKKNKDFINKKIFKTFINLLKQGITPQKLAFTVALAVVIGVFPVIGSTTLLCALAAIVFGLNLPAIQIVNYLVYPLQFILLIPFFNAGQFLFGNEAVNISVEKLMEMIGNNVWGAIQNMWTITLQAIVVWLLIAPVLSAVIYFLCFIIFRKIALTYNQKLTETPSI